jgi:hypothetical protein
MGFSTSPTSSPSITTGIGNSRLPLAIGIATATEESGILAAVLLRESTTGTREVRLLGIETATAIVLTVRRKADVIARNFDGSERACSARKT